MNATSMNNRFHRHLAFPTFCWVLYIIFAVLQPSEVRAQFGNPNVRYIQPDIGTPGLNTYIEIIGSESSGPSQFLSDGVYFNNPGEAVRVVPANLADTSKIIIGPLVVSANGKMIATQIFVLPTVKPNSWDWRKLDAAFKIPLKIILTLPPAAPRESAPEAAIFYIVKPFPAGTLNSKRGTVFGEGDEAGLGVRSPRGAMIVDSMTLVAGQRYTVSTKDCDPATSGNQGYLPFVLLSKGVINGNGATIDVSAVGKNGGVGGAGGGGVVCDETPITRSYSNDATDGGDGYTGGSAGGVNKSANLFNKTPEWKNGGNSTLSEPNQSRNGGSGLTAVQGARGTDVLDRPKDPQSSAGGTGHPFGSSGSSWDGVIASNGGVEQNVSGQGGGSGNEEKRQGDCGGYGSSGYSAYRLEKIGVSIGGIQYGNTMVVPIAGGSGGGGGNPSNLFGGCGGYGGGGGGAIRIYGLQVKNLTVLANGANAGGGGANNTGNPDGGAGSGGHVGIQSRLIAQRLSAVVNGGTNQGNGTDGKGGYGRIRYDVTAATQFDDILFTKQGEVYFGIVMDTTSTAKSPYTLDLKMKGSYASGVKRDTISIYTKTLTGKWNVTTFKPKFVEAQIPPWDTSITIPLTDAERKQTRLDSTFFVVAMHQIQNADESGYNWEPRGVLSQAAANIFRIEPLPKIEFGGGTAAGITMNETITCGESMAEETFTINNTRGGTLSISELTTTNRRNGMPKGFEIVTPTQFISADKPLIIQQGQPLQVTVRFKPPKDLPNFPVSQTIYDTLLIRHNDTIPDIDPATGNVLPVRGPETTIFLAAPVKVYTFNPVISPDPLLKVIDFGSVPVGQSSTQTVTITNNGSSDIALTIVPKTPQVFTIDISKTLSLLKGTTQANVLGQQTSFTLTYTPKVFGTTIEQFVTITLTGRGDCAASITPTLTLRGIGTEPVIDQSVSTKSVEVLVNRCSIDPATQTLILKLRNRGNDDLKIRSIVLLNEIPKGIKVFSTASTLTVGKNDVVPSNGNELPYNITFTLPPSATSGTYTADVQFRTNDRNLPDSIWTVPLTVTVKTTVFTVDIKPDTLNLGIVNFENDNTLPVSITNTGSSPIAIATYAIVQVFPSKPFVLVMPISPIRIAAGSTEKIFVRFAPSRINAASDPRPLVASVPLEAELRLELTPEASDSPCRSVPKTVILRATPIDPPSARFAFELDTLRAVEPSRDTTVTLFARLTREIGQQDLTLIDDMTATFRIEPPLFYPQQATPASGVQALQPRLDTNNINKSQSTRRVVLKMNGVVMPRNPSMRVPVAIIKGLPILSNTTGSALVLESVEWAKGANSPYKTESLRDGSFTMSVCLEGGSSRLVTTATVTRLVSMRPNPATEDVELSLNLPETGEYSVQLVTILGERTILQSWHKHGDEPNELETRVNLSRFPSGVYHLVLTTPSGWESRIVRVER